MESDYRSYLAANILSEDRVITYRLLSRALKVHVNTSKQMLFEFHRQQNGKKPRSVHATYLIAGSKRRPKVVLEKDGEDEHMQSSPIRSSPPPPVEYGAEDVPTFFITLVREEDLEELQTHYDKITSIHVYSLAPHPLKDLQVLTDSTREISDSYADRDPLEYAKTYGSIINTRVRRRSVRRPPPPANSIPTPPAKVAAVKLPTNTQVGESAPSSTSSKLEGNPSQSASAKDFFGKKTNGKQLPEKKPATNPPQLKRDSSNIFKSFAKAKPKLMREGTDSSAADSAVASANEDESMKDVSDEEEEEAFIVSAQDPNILEESNRKSREEKAKEAARKAALEKMMEDNEADDEPSPAHEAEVVDDPSLQDINAVDPAEETVEVKEGRRRGRKKVKKTVTSKDSEGYLVTVEQDAWESFSEDEPLPPKPKPVTGFAGGAKAKKAPGKVGQGSIMSFFGKK